MTERRLYKSRTNRMIAGVCGGVGEYCNVDPTLVRLLWFLSIFLGGTGVILYLVAAVIMPTNPSTESDKVVSGGSRNFWGIVLIGVGVLLLLYNFEILPMFFWWDGFSWKVTVAVLMIVVGITMVFSHVRQRATVSSESQQPVNDAPIRRRRLSRSVQNRKIFGVCGGLGEFFDVDPTIIRLLFVFVTFSSFGFGLVLYLILTLLMPEERFSTTTV